MAEENYTLEAELILEGLSDHPEMKAALFVVFLFIYMITLLGNVGIIVVIRGDARLHTSMYFFLGSLSVVDICFSFVIAPRTLVHFLSQTKTISFAGCTGQAFFYIVFVTTECFLLAVMAYDRYVAICSPLLYSAVMTRRRCIQLVVGSYLGGVVNSVIQMAFIIRLPFCNSRVINHFFCDVPPLLALSYHRFCLCWASHGGNAPGHLALLYIISTILQIHSANGRPKAFSTCAYHLVAVIVFYGTMTFIYLRPSSTYLHNQDRLASVFYTVVIPIPTPLIYSLKNQEVKAALRRVTRGKMFSL
ncbi:O1052 protein, partial [Dromaius novaehollandiae]|nr:O1052 protein [Dromaius novaehollandiae]